MKTKRILSLMLACCLVLVVLTACKEETDGNISSGSSMTANVESEDDGIFDLGSDIFGTDSESASSQTTSGSDGTASKGTTTVSSQPPKEYEKVEITDISKLPQYAQNAYKKLPNLKTDSEKKLSVLTNLAAPAHADLLGYKYGVTLDWISVPWNEVNTQYISRVNSGKSPDILIGDYNFPLISRQYVQAWDSYLNLSDPLWKDAKSANDMFTVSKKHYMLIPADPGIAHAGSYVFYNADVIKNAGLETPSELFAKDKWDWDAFAKIAEKLTDTKNKKYGAWLYNGPQMFLHTTGHDFIDFVNGRPQNMVKSAPVTRAIQAYSDLVAKKTIYFGGNAETLVARGDVAMAVTTLGGIMAFQDQVLKGNCGFTALPKDPQADSLYMPYIFNGFYLGKDAKHPNNAVAYMAIWNIMSQQDVKLEEVKEHWANKEEGAQSPEIMENILNISNKAKVTVITSNMFGNEFTITVSGIGQSIDGGEPWSKIAAQVSPVADAGIRASFGG